MASQKSEFDFTEGGRTYSCRLQGPDRVRTESWWWFDVSGDNNRYAPFRAGADDTEASIRTRIVAYYEDRIARRNRVDPRPRFGQHRSPPPPVTS